MYSAVQRLPLARAEYDPLLAPLRSDYRLASEPEVTRLPSRDRHEPDSYWQVFHWVRKD
jgi:hypothetical protein